MSCLPGSWLLTSVAVRWHLHRCRWSDCFGAVEKPAAEATAPANKYVLTHRDIASTGLEMMLVTGGAAVHFTQWVERMKELVAAWVGKDWLQRCSVTQPMKDISLDPNHAGGETPCNLESLFVHLPEERCAELSALINMYLVVWWYTKQNTLAKGWHWQRWNAWLRMVLQNRHLPAGNPLVFWWMSLIKVQGFVFVL